MRFFFALWFLSSVSLVASEFSLEFFIGEEKVKSVNLRELKKKLKIYKISFESSHYEKVKNYHAFKLHDVMDFSFQEKWRNEEEYPTAVFTALDGYSPQGEIEKMLEKDGYLAFEDLDVEGENEWEKTKEHKSDPAPYFLVWTDPKKTVKEAYPWPWQIKKISLLNFKEAYPKVYPAGDVKKDSAVFRGYTTFKEQCFRCHAMDKQGGVIGPDLGAPQTITDYRLESELKKFIRNPELFRYSHMPSHEHLTEKELDEMIAYFKHQSQNKKRTKR